MINKLNSCQVRVFRFFSFSPSSPPSSFFTPITYRTSLLSFSLVSISKPSSSWGPEFRAPPPFPASSYQREYTCHLDARRFTDMRASDRSLTVCDPPNIVCDTDVGAWVQRWLHCGGRAILVSRCISPEAECPLIRCYEEVQSVKQLLRLV